MLRRPEFSRARKCAPCFVDTPPQSITASRSSYCYGPGQIHWSLSSFNSPRGSHPHCLLTGPVGPAPGITKNRDRTIPHNLKMFKATPNLRNAIIRLPLTPKQAGKEYYKGNKIGKLGTIDKYGRFHPDYDKIRTYVYPAKGTKNFEVHSFCPFLPMVLFELEIWGEPDANIAFFVVDTLRHGASNSQRPSHANRVQGPS